jgi:hypothetical protein
MIDELHMDRPPSGTGFNAAARATDDPSTANFTPKHFTPASGGSSVLSAAHTLDEIAAATDESSQMPSASRMKSSTGRSFRIRSIAFTGVRFGNDGFAIRHA